MSKDTEASSGSCAIAAQCWCEETTSMIEMDSRLAKVFARKLDELKELHQMQLVGIMTASIQNTERTIKDRITQENPYWTVAYHHTCRAVDREIKERKKVQILRASLLRMADVTDGELDLLIQSLESMPETEDRDRVLPAVRALKETL